MAPAQRVLPVKAESLQVCETPSEWSYMRALCIMAEISRERGTVHDVHLYEGAVARG